MRTPAEQRIYEQATLAYVRFIEQIKKDVRRMLRDYGPSFT